MTKIAFVSAAFLVLFHQIHSQCLTPDDSQAPPTAGRKNLYTGQQEFSLNLLRAVNQLDPEGNLFFSPYSTYHALLLAYFISGGQTEQFLRKTLRLDAAMNKADFMKAYKLDKLQTKLRSQKNEYQFSNANRIYVDGGIEVRPCIPELFSDEFEKIDFASKPEESRVIINKWVENQTNSMIQDLLPSGSIDQTTNLALVNAGYFKGSWKYEFNADHTQEEPFHISPTKRTLVKMMNMEGVLNHDVSEVLGAQILELPYKGETVSMYILLPPFLKEDGIANTLKKLTPETFHQVIKNLTDSFGKTVNVQLPKFTLEHTIEMTPILEKLGVGDLFSGTANFSTATDDGLRLSNALHKAKIDVNEQGTEAAAATVLFSFRSSRPAEPVEFRCKHPFIYVIYDKLSEAIVFMGVFRRPY